MENDKKLRLLLEAVELPDRAYEAAKRRYDDLGAWFDRDACTLGDNDPHIFVQGSFALGTAIRPTKEGQEYDLDLSCKLRKGVDRSTHSQRQLKDMIGRELESYRNYRHIEERLEPKHRCWRLKYSDDLRFHLDVVPGIPVESARRVQLELLIEQRGVDKRLSRDIAAEAVWITDDRKRVFNQISSDWLSSNPEGYVRWFVSRMEGTRSLLEKRAQVDDVPVYRRKTALQRVIQLLKSHRDAMFENTPESKPISIILTTIAGQAYAAGQSLTESMTTILQAFEDFRRSNSDDVPNPVNPEENFTDRWKQPECQHLRLKENFHRWIVQAGADFQYVMSQTDPRELMKRAQTGFKVTLDEKAVAAALGFAATTATSFPRPRQVSIQSPPKPWSHNR
jgi:hypothetical protein